MSAVSQVARHIGACAARNPPFASREDLWTAFLQYDADATAILEFCAQVRQNRRSRPSVGRIRRGGAKQHSKLLSQTWDLYCLLRRRASPFAKIPQTYVNRNRTQSDLRKAIKAGKAHHADQTMVQKAHRALTQTWNSTARQQCALWVDNWYSGQRGTQPEGTNDLSTSALALIKLRQRVPWFRGQPSLGDMYLRIRPVSRVLAKTDRGLMGVLHDLGANALRVPWNANLRQPLDVKRDPATVQPPSWKPLTITDEKVGDTVGLVNVLDFTTTLVKHTNNALPLLVDENIHYRILKMLYGNKTTQWRVGVKLAKVPLVYGVWHAYKFCVTQTFRSFWPLLTYFRFGTLAPKVQVAAYPKLRVMEKTVCCLLRAYRGYERAAGRKVRCCIAQANQGPRQANRAAVATAVYNMLTQYLPLLVYLGWLVRECSWASPNTGSGVLAVEAQRVALVLLCHLRQSDDSMLKYQRTLGAALL